MGAGEVDMERGTWSGKLDFFLSAVGYAVGIGNVWRFPHMTYKNGGASFLFPYIIMLVIAGLPLFFLELSIGQFTSQGPMTCWQMAPVFTGIGYGMVCVSAVVSIYYNMIITYAVYYMLVSFVHLGEDLPWEFCDNDWNTPECRSEAMPKLSDYANETQKRDVLYDVLYKESCVNETLSGWGDSSETGMKFLETFKLSELPSFEDLLAKQVEEFEGFAGCEKKYNSPADEYYRLNVLNEGDNESLNDIGEISTKLAITHLFSWILIFACLMKGIKTSGKVVYFTATFPYLVLIVLFIRGVTLDGAWKGIKFYVVPEWDKLTDATIWGDAASQIFYSLGVGFGGLLTMASYNKFNNNCHRDAIMVSVINCGTSIFAGFAIFSMLGHMAEVTNKEVDDVAKSGTGLAFIAYPDGISQLPGSAIWAFLFFFMLLTLGMDSQFAMIETIISSVSDIFPNFLRKWKTPFTFILCIVGYFLGLPLCTEGGGRVLSLMNNYSGSYNLMIIALCEIICTCYVYGYKRFQDDIKMMLGFKPNLYWTVNWLFITPVAVVFIVIVSAIQYETGTHNGKEFEGWAEGVGWLMVGTPIALIIIVGIIMCALYGLKEAFQIQHNWGPSLPEDRTGRYAVDSSAPYSVPYSNGTAAEEGLGNSKDHIIPGFHEKSADGSFDNPNIINSRF